MRSSFARMAGTACLAALGAIAATRGYAQAYPAKPVTVIVPFAAGSPTDAEGRLLAQDFESALGKPAIVVNRAGAGGMLGSEAVARAAPDGYTLLFGVASITAYRVLSKDLRFDPAKDLAPVSLVLEFPVGFATNGKVPARTIEEFVAYAKANPGKLNSGSTGRSAVLLSFEALNTAAGIKLSDIPYAGMAQYLPALLRDDVQLIQAPINLGLKSYIDTGAVKPLLILGTRRSPSYPDVPTAADKGWNIPNNGWVALFTTGGTPRAIVDRLAAETARYIASPAVQKRGKDGGVNMVSSTPDQLRQLVENDSRVWADVAQRIGLQPE